MPPVLKAPPPSPRGGPHRRPVFRGRIEGLGSPVPTSLRASTPTLSRASTPIAQPQSRSKVLCPNPDCPDRSKVTRGDQGFICESCGALVQEESGLVSEQGFGETESGRIVAQGTQIAQNQTHQKNYAAGGAYGNAGREATSSSERTRHQARIIMNSYCPLLNIQSSDVERGLQWFGLACANGFLAGRTIESVAVAALYIACKRKKEQVQGKKRPVYGLMLIDFAEKLNMDVFALGKIYHDLYQKLWYDSATGEWADKNDGKDDPTYVFISEDFQGMDPAVLVPKFVQALEFDRRDEPKIQHDAIQIIKRMKRDWIHHGRRPSGVCGAAVLLAARMNNYRRTAREIVLTAKVTEITLNKRLQEFQDTQASTLSVTGFMKEAKVWGSIASEKEQKMDHHYLDENLPPITKEQMKPKEKKKRGRPRKRPLPETAAEIEGDTATPEPQATDDEQPPPAKRVRIDAEGYKIPDIPARKTGGETPQTADDTPSAPQAQSQGLEDEASSLRQSPSPSEGGSNAGSEKPNKKGRGLAWQAPPPSQVEIAMEFGIDDAMCETLAENPELAKECGVEASGKRRKDVPHSITTDAGPSQAPSREGEDDPQEDPMDLDTDPTQTIRPHKKDKILGPPADSEIGNLGYVSLSPTLKPEEFDSDEDVSTCTLTEAESRIKERVWVSMNADWLRKDHAKRIKKELKDADMRAKGLDPAEEERKKKATQKMRKDGSKRPGRRGDVGYLKEGLKKKKAPAGEGGEEEDDNAEDGEGSAEPEEPRTAARAVRLMMENRGTFSQRINYDALDAIYGTEGTSEESAESRSATGEGRSRSASIATSEAGEVDANAQAGPSTAGRKKSTLVNPAAIFRANQERGKRRRTQPAVPRNKARLARNALKKSTEAAEGKSASRSRSASTPTSEAAGPSANLQGQVPGTPASEAAAQATDTQAQGQTQETRAQVLTQGPTEAQDQAQLPLPTPPAMQLSPPMPEPTLAPILPKRRRRWYHSQPKAKDIPPTPPASLLGPQIPGIKISAPKPPPPVEEEEESEEETEEEEEEEDELEAALGGRLKARGSDEEDDDDDDDNEEAEDDEEDDKDDGDE